MAEHEGLEHRSTERALRPEEVAMSEIIVVRLSGQLFPSVLENHGGRVLAYSGFNGKYLVVCPGRWEDYLPHALPDDDE
jgi:hypothetical protein